MNSKSTLWLGLVTILLLACAATGARAAAGGSGRTVSITPEMVQKVLKGEVEELTVEFRAGDRMPLQVQLEGDLLESTESASIPVVVRRGFFLRLRKEGFFFSADGKSFQPFQQALRGVLTVGAQQEEATGLVNGLNILLQTHLK